jgi:predicted nucleotidyltransferase
MSRTTEPTITMPPDPLGEFCRRRHICLLAVFDSTFTDGFGPDSPIDLLVAFHPGHSPGPDTRDIEDELSRLFGGHRVNLVEEPSPDPERLHRILEFASVQYLGR